MNITFSHDLVSTLISINGIFVTSSTVFLCLLAVSKAEVIEYLKSKKTSNGGNRYKKLLTRAKITALLNICCILAGMDLILFVAETKQLQEHPFALSIFLSFLLCEIVCFIQSFKINRSFYLLLECL